MDYLCNKNESSKEKESPLVEYFKEVIYGGIDGIITTFAVVAGFSGAMLSNGDTAQLTFMVVLLFGLANLFADATSMGLGNYLSVRSDKDLYTKTRLEEGKRIDFQPEEEKKITITILKEKGFSEADAMVLVDIYEKNKDYWLDFIMNHKLDVPDSRCTNPVLTGFATFLSFLVFGAVPLLPFIFMETQMANLAFYFSLSGTFIALIILGLLKWRITKVSLLSSLTEVILVGGVAATIAYYVGTLFAV